MRLKRVVIQNFKSFSNVDFDLNDHHYFDVLIGKNDSGKSNFLQALNIKKIFEEGFENDDFKFSYNTDTLIKLFFQPSVDNVLSQFMERMKQSFETAIEYYLNKFSKIPTVILLSQNEKKWKSDIEKKIKTLIFSNLNSFSNFEKRDLHNEKFCFVWELKHQNNDDFKNWGLNLVFSFKKKIWKPLEEAVNMIKKELGENKSEEITSLNRRLDKLIDPIVWLKEEIKLEMPEFSYLVSAFSKENDEKKIISFFVILYFWCFLIQFQILAKQFWNESIIWFQDTFFDGNLLLKSEYNREEFVKNRKLLNFLIRNKSVDDQKTVEHFLKKNTWEKLKGFYQSDIERIFTIQSLAIETLDLNENFVSNDNDIKETMQLELHCRISDHTIKFWVNDKKGVSGQITDLNQRSKGFKSLMGFWMIYSHLFSNPIKEKSSKIKNFSDEKIEFFSQSIFDNYSETEELKFFSSFWEKSFYKFFNNNIFENFSFKLLLIDEPENHFHASRQKSILNKLIKSSQDNKVNVFVATHSPWFVNWQNSVSTMVIERISESLKHKFESQIYACLDDFFQKMQKNENERRLNLKHNSLIPIQLALGAEFDFVFLETGKKFVFVEGSTDVLIFKWFWEKKQPKYKNLVFVPLHGDLKSNSLIFAAAMNMPLIVLVDNDQGGSNMLSSLDNELFWQLYKQKFEKRKINCSLTLSKISSELTTIESIFNEKERKDLFLKEPKDKQFLQKNNNSNNKKNHPKQSWYKTLSKLYEKKIDDFSPKTMKNLEQIFDFINDLFQKMENKK